MTKNQARKMFEDALKCRYLKKIREDVNPQEVDIFGITKYLVKESVYQVMEPHSVGIAYSAFDRMTYPPGTEIVVHEYFEPKSSALGLTFRQNGMSCGTDTSVVTAIRFFDIQEKLRPISKLEMELRAQMYQTKDLEFDNFGEEVPISPEEFMGSHTTTSNYLGLEKPTRVSATP